MPIDRAALAAGSIRLASGVSFLVDPVRANRLWGDPDEPAPTARLLLRSMGYRDALIGGLLATGSAARPGHPRLVPCFRRRRRGRPTRRDERPPRDEALATAHRPRRRGRRYRRRALGCDAAKPAGGRDRLIAQPAPRSSLRPTLRARSLGDGDNDMTRSHSTTALRRARSGHPSAWPPFRSQCYAKAARAFWSSSANVSSSCSGE